MGLNDAIEAFRTKKWGKAVNKAIPVLAKAACELERASDLPGREKLDWAAKLAAGAIDLPGIPEWMEVFVAKLLITAVVELARLVWGEKPWYTGLEKTLHLEDVKLAALPEAYTCKDTGRIVQRFDRTWDRVKAVEAGVV